MKKGISIALGGALATLIWMSAVSADRTDKQPVSTTDSCYVYTAENGRMRTIRLERQNDSLFVLRHSEGDRTLSEWQLPYPVYRFDCGDLTGNGTPEIAVGVIKPTRYFPTPDKRLFLFKLHHGTLIRALWMGSRVARPLENFRVVRDSVPARILTTERATDGTLVQSLYRQAGFGLRYEGIYNYKNIQP